MTIYRSSPIETELTVDEEFHRAYSSTYQVLASKRDSGISVLSAPAIPAYGDAYVWFDDYDLWAFARTGSAKIREKDVKMPDGTHGNLWTVVITHSSRPRDNSSGDARENPLDQPPRVSGSFLKTSEPKYRDKDGKLIVNTAKEAYDPPIQGDRSFDTLSMSYNTATLDLGFRSDFADTVNSNTMWGLAARQIKLMKWSYSVEFFATTAYIKHDFEFLINKTVHPTSDVCTGPSNGVGWYTTLQNNGHRYYPGGYVAGKKYRSAEDGKDNAVHKAINLKCDGDQELDATLEKWNVFAIEKEADFSTIPGMPSVLPGPFA